MSLREAYTSPSLAKRKGHYSTSYMYNGECACMRAQVCVCMCVYVCVCVCICVWVYNARNNKAY